MVHKVAHLVKRTLSPERSLPAGPASERRPDRRQVEDEAGQLGVGGDLGGIVEALDGLSRSVDLDAPFVGVDQPAAAGAVVAVLRHLRLEVGEGVRRRPQLDDEVRAKGKEAPLLLRGEAGQPGALDPRRVRRAHRAVGQDEPARGVEGDPAAVPLGPVGQGGDDPPGPDETSARGRALARDDRRKRSLRTGS
jgi:hypothetical protein